MSRGKRLKIQCQLLISHPRKVLSVVMGSVPSTGETKPATATRECKSSIWTATMMDVQASDQLGVGCCQNSDCFMPWRPVNTIWVVFHGD